jgi:hypothetical protein
VTCLPWTFGSPGCTSYETSSKKPNYFFVGADFGQTSSQAQTRSQEVFCVFARQAQHPSVLAFNFFLTPNQLESFSLSIQSSSPEPYSYSPPCHEDPAQPLQAKKRHLSSPSMHHKTSRLSCWLEARADISAWSSELSKFWHTEDPILTIRQGTASRRFVDRRQW